jgi:hypothetical protein
MLQRDEVNIVTVTKSTDTPRCGWCNRPVPDSAGAGRPRRFCCRSHRQRSYEARRRAEQLQIPDGQTVVSQEDLRKLHDRLYRLESAVQDVDADLRELSGLRAYREALDHLLEAARDLVGVTVEPVRQ